MRTLVTLSIFLPFILSFIELFHRYAPLRIVRCSELPQWIISSDRAAYHPFTRTIYITKWRYLPHELRHYFIHALGLPKSWHGEQPK